MGRRSLIPWLMWLLALVYPAFSLVTVLALRGLDPLAAYSPLYLLSSVLLLPPALMLVAIWLGSQRGAPGWGWTFVLLLWIAGVGYLHYLFIGIAASRI